MSEISILKKTSLLAGLLVAAFACVDVLTILEPPAFSQVTEVLGRGPASLPEEFPQIAATEIATELNLDCSSETETGLSFGSEVRIMGTNCAGPKSKPVVSIVNLSNGFSATVFPLTGTAFTTDFISLNRGENRIEMSHVGTSGKKQTRSFVLQGR